MRHKNWNQRGVAAVEFALVLPVLVLLLLGIIEFSVALYDKAVVTNASREGARAGIVFRDPPMTEGEIAGVVTSYCQDRMITFGSVTQVTTNVIWEGMASGDDLTVRVLFQYQFLAVPNFVADLAGGIQLGGQTVMRME